MPFEAIDPANATQIAGSYAAPLTGIAGQFTRAELRDELNLRLGSRTDVTPTRLNSFINIAYKEIASYLEEETLKQSFSLNTTVGEDQYILPVGVYVADNVAVSDSAWVRGGYMLEKVVDLWAWRRLALLTDFDHVMRFFQFKTVMALWPMPTVVQSITVDCELLPQDLAADGDQTIFGREWDQALLQYAKYVAHDALLERELAALAMNEALATIRAKNSKRGKQRSNAVPAISIPRNRGDLGRTGRDDLWPSR